MTAPAPIHHCLMCGIPFGSSRKGAKYCSSLCALTHARRVRNAVANRKPVHRQRAKRKFKMEPEIETELQRFMNEPELVQLRAGIRHGIEQAFRRCFESSGTS